MHTRIPLVTPAVLIGLLALAGQPALAAATSSHPAAAASEAGPAQVVRETATKLLKVLDQHQSELKKNPEEAYKLVHEYLLPHFDFDLTAQLVLGRFWRTATPAQRKEFKHVFLRYLINTYATGLAHYKGAKIKVLPFRGNPNHQYVKVRTKVYPDDQSPVEVDYALTKTPSGWKAFDVIIEGISYVQTYRTQFDAEVERTSLNALISKLKQEKAGKPLGPAHKKSR